MLPRGEWSGAWVRQWDADNRAVAITNTTTGGRVAFVYDGDGRRVREWRVPQFFDARG